MEENKDWFKDLFINEAKPAMERHSGGNMEEQIAEIVSQLSEIVEVI